MKCKSIKSNGKKCKANAMHESPYCFRHNISKKKEATQASSAGGRARKQYNCLGSSIQLETPKDIQNLWQWLSKVSGPEKCPQVILQAPLGI